MFMVILFIIFFYQVDIFQSEKGFFCDLKKNMAAKLTHYSWQFDSAISQFENLKLFQLQE